MDIRLFVDGHVDDLYAFALLFPEGAYPGLYVKTKLKGRKDGNMDRVTESSDKETYVTGDSCAVLVERIWANETFWLARELVAPLNGYAVLADSNFSPLKPYRLTAKSPGFQLDASIGSDDVILNSPQRLISVARHRNIAAMRNARVKLMTEKPLASYAASVISGQPNWADYYRILEDIAGDVGVTLNTLTEKGLAEREPLDAFKKAANNRAFGRHGASKRDLGLDQKSLMNLIEAREFVRSVVSKWLDAQVGNTMPTTRVDGGPLRFGLDLWTADLNPIK